MQILLIQSDAVAQEEVQLKLQELSYSGEPCLVLDIAGTRDRKPVWDNEGTSPGLDALLAAAATHPVPTR